MCFKLLMRYLAIASLIIVVILALPPINHVEGQIALLGVSDNEVVAGGSFFAFYNMTTQKDKPIVGFRLSLIVPKNWKITPYNASGITPEGKKIEIMWENGTAVYEGTGASVAHVAFRVQVPLEDMDVQRTIFAKGYLLVKEGNTIRKYIVTGKKEILVHRWEPLIFINLSKTEVVPPAILIAYVRVLTGPPLHPTAMRDVVVRVEDTATGPVYNETVKYWYYGRALDLRIPIKIPMSASGGEQKIYVTVDYEVAGRRLRSYVEYPYKILKPAEIRIDRINVPKEVNLGERIAVNATLLNPSSFKALDVEFHAKLGNDHRVVKVGSMEPGAFTYVNLTFTPKSMGNLTLTIWAVWEQEYPKEIKSLNETTYTIQVVRPSIPWWPFILLVVVIGIAAAEYMAKRRGGPKTEEASRG